MNEEQEEINLWSISEETFSEEKQAEAEQIFSLANGHIGQPANFEEFYSAKTSIGTQLSGVYCLKNEVKTLSNLPNWTSLNVRLNTELVDLAQCEIISFHRTLNMKQGILERHFEIKTANNEHIEVCVHRFLSLAQPEIAAIKYSLKSLGFVGRITFSPVIDGDFNSTQAPDDEPEWNVLQSKIQQDVAHLWIQTRKTNFQVCEAMTFDFFKNNAQIKLNPTKIEKQKVAGFSFGTDLKTGDSVCVYKFVAIFNSTNHPYQELTAKAREKALQAKNTGWNELLEENSKAWKQHWETTGLSPQKTDQSTIIKAFKELQPS